ncbi:peptidoglycan-binding protein [Naumannella halotolerans]|uniref:L,D-transpeptidase family protein n=1 Tax=Naumannella halotolerans TaxID=993414 RepID=UPI00370D2B0F
MKGNVCALAVLASAALVFTGCAPNTPSTDTAVVAPAPAVVESSTPTPTPTQSPTPSASPTPTTEPALLAKGDSGDEVKDLQARLKQIAWWNGKISGEYDDQTVSAIKGFQAKRELPETGEVDQKTLDALHDMTREPTDDEKNNRLTPGKAILKDGDSGDKVKDLQARLKQLDWFTEDVTGNYGSVTVAAVKGFQAKREIPETGEVDQRTLDKLNEMTTEPTDEELNNKPKKEDKDDEKSSDSESKQGEKAEGLPDECMTGKVMCISKKSNKLWWLKDGVVSISFDVRFGTDETPTREGTFYVDRMSKDHVSNMYHTPMPYAMFFSRGQAVHYSSDFAARGYNGGSHGCVNVRDKGKVAELYSQVSIGTKVYVYS